jgi:hypothetical protein
MSENTYAILMETNETEGESWYTFIKYQGNEEALLHLESQLDRIDWKIEEDLSTFTLETGFLVSDTTAKEMIRVDLNAGGFHNKFDGKLEKIHFKIKKKDSNVKKMNKVFNKLGYGQIKKFVDGEDLEGLDVDEELESLSEYGENVESESSDECEDTSLPRSLSISK